MFVYTCYVSTYIITMVKNLQNIDTFVNLHRKINYFFGKTFNFCWALEVLKLSLFSVHEDEKGVL